MSLSLVLASRFIDFRLDKSNKFHLSSAVVRQVRGAVWFLIGTSINLWFVVAVATDRYFREAFCDDSAGGGGGAGGCCPACVWAFGIVFLVLSVLVGGVSRAYQCAILHRLSSELWCVCVVLCGMCCLWCVVCTVAMQLSCFVVVVVVVVVVNAC